MVNGKINILLDLDQTLISAEASEDFDLKKHKDKAKKFTFHDMDGYYVVFERPGLQKFLTYLFKNFNVSVWTAASKDYALFIVDKIVLANHPDRKLDYIFFSYHCDISKNKKKGSKDLSLIWDEFKLPAYNNDNTMILDDYDEVHNTQPGNCIIALPFEFTHSDSEKDKYLSKLQSYLEKMKADNFNEQIKEINDKIKKFERT